MNYELYSNAGLSAPSRIIKRAADIVAAIVLLILLLAPGAAIGVLIRIGMGKPVLFIQQRPGRYEVPFKMLKFRTMSEERSEGGGDLPDRARVTRMGRLLRMTSLDELPQLLNVLRGDMSFIGPRPLLMQYLPYFRELERVRFTVRPGITGWAQINGRNTVGWTDRLELDSWYVTNWSLALDFYIAMRTIWAVVRRGGFEPDPETRMMNLDRERTLEGPDPQ